MTQTLARDCSLAQLYRILRTSHIRNHSLFGRYFRGKIGPRLKENMTVLLNWFDLPRNWE